jgi:predicted ATP-binding protein involved in virulence
MDVSIKWENIMKINQLDIKNFRPISDTTLCLNGKSTVIFGVNGTGKSSVLKAVNLLYAQIINRIVNRKELKQNYSLALQDIKYGKAETKISAKFLLEGEIIEYHRSMIRKSGRKTHDLESLKKIAETFQKQYFSDEKQGDIPIFVNYGTNRLVLDIPLRIRTKHEFDIYSAFEKSIENRIDFRTFFEWFRNQEDYENECKIESGNLEKKDLALEAVRKAVMVMLDDCKNLRVARKPRLEMKIDKNGIALNVSQLSDGEKCTMVLFGDLARRLTIANPNMENPLLGEGVVLIDEIELHMHPSWQRKVLKCLEQTFPNIQFIITTHSPIVLSEIDDNYNLFFMHMTENNAEAILQDRLDGYDTNEILEEFMGTASANKNTEKLIHSIYVCIQQNRYEEAESGIAKLIELTSENHPEVITARLEMKRRRLR